MIAKILKYKITIFFIFFMFLYSCNKNQEKVVLVKEKNQNVKIIHFIDMLIRNHILFLINSYLSIKINNFIIKNRDYIFLADFGTEDIFPYDYLIHKCKTNNVKINVKKDKI